MTGAEERGVLFVVATPIGNLGDMSPRAREALAQVDAILAEDTRRSGRLLSHYGIRGPLISFHEHNERERLPGVLARLAAGENLALVSDAGTPLISDPGFRLVRAARGAGYRVTPVPGPSSVIAALSVAGIPSDRFVFEGFLPSRRRERRTRLAALAAETRTWIVFESSHRIAASLADMAEIVGPGREACLARELTKLHETIVLGSLGEIVERIARDPDQRRGEFVVVIHGSTERPTPVEALDLDHVLDTLLGQLSVKQAAELASRITGLSRNRVYRLALSRRKGAS
jgi:16S rRNA (cytidine1402-2'-O)-methyltransferase